MSQKFLYFSYGSNMLADRIHINSPSAVRVGYGVLEGWIVDFKGFTEFWQGAPSTIIPDQSGLVMGAIWELDIANMPNLDSQEGVSTGHYYPADLSVFFSEDGETVIVRAYILKDNPTESLKKLEIDKVEIPFDRLPSKTYLQCIVKGAIESRIPAEYVERLKAMRHNGRVAQNLEKSLGLKAVELYS